MRIYSKPLLWQTAAVAGLLFFQAAEAYVAAVTEEDLGGYLKLVKRVNVDGSPNYHLDLHERWHDDELGRAIRKRGEDGVEAKEDVYSQLLPNPTPEEKDTFRSSFDYICGGTNTRGQIATVEELSGAAMSVMSKSGHYELEGWSTPGVISLGNQASEPKKYQSAIPIHCLGGPNKYTLILTPKNIGAEFKYGISMSRYLIARCLHLMIKVCEFDLQEKVLMFSFSPKNSRLSMAEVTTFQKDCENWVQPLCRSTDDESKAECLTTKSLLGISWTETKPTPTKPKGSKKA
ncbi:hypothetical protein TWF481_008770 [Arthrobotrys musiformis]|uniref:Uncharacterized protein n=1 Tax=Arthrobotrys musiformis TaxID=47236 RepID=A0AAV9W867_9PEZI